MLKKQNPTLSPKRFQSSSAVDLVETIASLTRGFSVGTNKPDSKKTGGLGEYSVKTAPMVDTKRGESDLNPDFLKALNYTTTIPVGAMGMGDLMMYSDYLTSKIPLVGQTNVGRAVAPTAALNVMLSSFLNDIGYKGDIASQLGTTEADKTAAEQQYQDALDEIEKQREEAEKNAQQQNESYNKIEYSSYCKKGTPFLNYARGFIID